MTETLTGSETGKIWGPFRRRGRAEKLLLAFLSLPYFTPLSSLSSAVFLYAKAFPKAETVRNPGGDQFRQRWMQSGKYKIGYELPDKGIEYQLKCKTTQTSRKKTIVHERIFREPESKVTEQSRASKIGAGESDCKTRKWSHTKRDRQACERSDYRWADVLAA